MNEEIEYAEMLEIPVSTVNVVKKKSRRVRGNNPPDLKADLIARVNRRVNGNEAYRAAPAGSGAASPRNFTQSADSATSSVVASASDATEANISDVVFDENAQTAQNAQTDGAADEGNYIFKNKFGNNMGAYDGDWTARTPSDRIDTVPIFSEEKQPRRGLGKFFHRKKNMPENAAYSENAYSDNAYAENAAADFSAYSASSDGGRVEPNGMGANDYASFEERNSTKKANIVLISEFAAACALCGAIFLTNIFMPNSGVNTFFKSLKPVAAAKTDTRVYSDFTLSGVVSDLSDAEITVSPAGILSFTGKCCVYPAVDGTVSEVAKTSDGTYTVKISHTDRFSGEISGLDFVYYAAGDKVYAQVPVGYSNGEAAVRVSMYADGELLNCYTVDGENCLAWAKSNN